MLISIVTVPVYTPANNEEGSSFPLSSIASVVIYFLLMAVLTGMRWSLKVINLKVVVIGIFLLAKSVEHFFNYLLTFVFFLLRTVCSVHLLN